jgi:hypothetical protein
MYLAILAAFKPFGLWPAARAAALKKNEVLHFFPKPQRRPKNKSSESKNWLKFPAK